MMKAKKDFFDEELQGIVHEKTHENEEMYLKVIYILEENGVKPVHSNDLAKVLKIALPSVVEMLGKLDKKSLIKYEGRKGIYFKPKGKQTAKNIVRGLRLFEVFLKNELKIKNGEKYACKFEHAANQEVLNALNKHLKNPTKCPHGKPIPK